MYLAVSQPYSVRVVHRKSETADLRYDTAAVSHSITILATIFWPDRAPLLPTMLSSETDSNPDVSSVCLYGQFCLDNTADLTSELNCTLEIVIGTGLCPRGNISIGTSILRMKLYLPSMTQIKRLTISPIADFVL